MQCAACGKVNDQGAQFCNQCGTTLAAQQIAFPTPVPQSSYAPPQPAKKGGSLLSLLGALLLIAVVLGIIGAVGNRNNAGQQAVPGLSSQGQRVQSSLASGQTCTATWTENSSREGQKTTISDVRVLNGGTQFYTYHSPEQGSIWTWEERLAGITCR